MISGEVETMQLWLDGSQCKWLVNLKRKAWALKDVVFTQERDGAALAEHVRDGVLLHPLSNPRLETMKGTTKFVPHLIQVIAVAPPRTITSSWLTVVRTMPPRSAIRTVRRRCSRRGT